MCERGSVGSIVKCRHGLKVRRRSTEGKQRKYTGVGGLLRFFFLIPEDEKEAKGRGVVLAFFWSPCLFPLWYSFSFPLCLSFFAAETQLVIGQSSAEERNRPQEGGDVFVTIRVQDSALYPVPLSSPVP